MPFVKIVHIINGFVIEYRVLRLFLLLKIEIDMEKLVFYLSAILLICSCSTSPEISSDTDQEALKFNSNGKFKIAQFTDIHFNIHAPESLPALELIAFILDTEKPDLVVFSGDIVTSRNESKAWDMIFNPVVKRNIPFAVTLGNHDDEHDLTRDKIRNIVDSYEDNIIHLASAISDQADHIVKLNDRDGNTAALLYFLDSNAYSTVEGIEGWGWFNHSQVSWYLSQSAALKSENKGEPLPAWAFFHIPLPEYREAFDAPGARFVGQRNEDECAGLLNTGMYTAMLLSGDVTATFVGHDHVNDYLVDHYGIALAYGRFSGGKNTYGDLMPGSRIIELTEGQREFSTWLRLADGQKVDSIVFPFED
jgi:hypothetical protein